MRKAVLPKILSVLIGLCSVGLEACKNEQSTTIRSDRNSAKEFAEKDPDIAPNIPAPSFVLEHDLADIQHLNPDIYVDLKYATKDNFMGEVLYDSIRRGYLQKSVARRLSKCQRYLTSMDSTLHLLVYDAVRPRSVQQRMWDALDTIPVSQRIKFVSNPKHASLHNLGCAVDVTICNYNRIPLDMGAGYDDMRTIAYPSLETKYVASGELTKQQLENRKLLRKVMHHGRFFGIPTEWWHFNAYTRVTAKFKYEVIE